MSIRVLSRVFEHSESELGARLVLLALADAAHDDGISWMNQATIATKARLSESQVRRTTKTLVELGELEVVKTRNGRRNVNVYRVLLSDREPELDRMPSHIAALFSTAQSARVKENLTRANPPVSPAHPAQNPSDAPPIGNRKGPAQAKHLSDDEKMKTPPPLVNVEHRNVSLDALADVCALTAGEPAYNQAIGYLNGRKAQGGRDPERGIVHLAWGELAAWAEHDPAARVPKMLELHDDPERWQTLLESMIRAKAERYRDRMADVFLTAKALRDWWLRLERLDTLVGGRSLSAADIEKMPMPR